MSDEAKRRTILILSGGLDSVTALYHLRALGREVSALSVHYGQRHRRELAAAAAACSGLGVEFRLIDLFAAGIAPLLAGSSQTDAAVPVPEGHYAEETMKATIVPNRNMIMLSLAIAWAISRKANAVAYAAHAGDHAIYPDCRAEFVDALAAAARLADWHAVAIERPFIAMTKAEIVKRGADLGVPFAETWSCYKGGDAHCGLCGTCVERREAFSLAGVADPTEYRSGAVAAMPAGGA